MLRFRKDPVRLLLAAAMISLVAAFEAAAEDAPRLLVHHRLNRSES